MNRGSPPTRGTTGRVPEGQSRHPRRWVVATLVAVPTLLILLTMLGLIDPSAGPGASALRFPDLFRATTPTGGDIGAHIMLPKLLTESLLPSGRLFGWSNAWFAGFPVLYLYFPLPMVVIVILNVLLPYGVAFKLVVAGGLVVLPTSTYVLVRWLGFERLVAGVAAVMGGAFVFMESYSIFGGNIKSVMAGEFSFSWSLALAALYLGLLARQMRGRSSFDPLPGMALGLVALTHIVSVVVVVAASAPFLLRRASARAVVMSWFVGFGLSAFWSVPFAHIVLSDLTANLNWSPTTGIFGDGLPVPMEIVPVLVLGVVGFVWSAKRGDQIGLLLGMTLSPLVLYVLMPLLGISNMHNGRFLPYWYFGVFVFAGIGIGLAVVTLGHMEGVSSYASSLAAAVASATIMLTALALTVDAPNWVHDGFAGYEETSGYAEYGRLVDSIDRLPPGRVVWEHNDDLYRFGGPLATVALPYWSPEHPTMKGLYVEASPTTPFNYLNESEISWEPSFRIPGLRYHDMDFDRAVPHLALYDVRYFVSFTDESADAATEFGLTDVASEESWTVFELPPTSPIEVATNEPAVWSGPQAFSDAALGWYDDVGNLDLWLTEFGPAKWPKVAAIDDRVALPIRPRDADEGTVTNVAIDEHQISFDTAAVGIPHLVKVSYFPNWRAEGADGPYRAAPSLMVVVPTQESVVVRFGRSGFEYLGIALTLLTVVALGVWAVRNRVRSRTDEQYRS